MTSVEKSELEQIIADSAPGIKKVDAINALAFEIRNTDTHRAISLSHESFELAASLNYRIGKATALNNEAFCHVQITDYDKALEKLMAALEIFESEKDERGLAQAHYNFCILYFRLGDYGAALDGVNKSRNYYEKVNNEAELARCYFQMGLLYHYLNDHNSAVDYQVLGIELAQKSGLKTVEAACKMGLGHVYMILKEFEKSKALLYESLELRENIKDWRGYGASLNALMNYFLEVKKYDEVEDISAKGIKLATELGDKMGISRFMMDHATVCFRKNQIELAREKALDVLAIAEKINLKMALTPAHQLLSEIYQKSGDFEKALHHFQAFHKAHMETNQVNAAMKAKSIQFVNKVESAQKEAEINRLKNVELKNAFEEIEEKNREITASITYALRIQTAILPSNRIVKQYLESSFILYKPKDIVAGDFYWVEIVDNLILFAACDCTGHGVPGAMVSVVCHNALNRAVREFGLIQPSLILDKTAEIMRENFRQSEEDIKDGMDISLCAYHQKSKTIQWAGANNPLWVVRNGELTETKANKQPIGAHDNYAAFTQHQFAMQTGDMVYVFSDGYADQFGGEYGNKKLTKKGFKDLVLSIHHKSMQEQMSTLDQFHRDYRKSVEQIDDVLVIGVRV